MGAQLNREALDSVGITSTEASAHDQAERATHKQRSSRNLLCYWLDLAPEDHVKHSHKEYEKAFLLEPTKLTRLVDTIHDRLSDHPNAFTRDSFEVFLSGNRREEVSTLDDVLTLDNSRRRKIGRLVILSACSNTGSARPEHEVQVDFGGPKPGATGNAPKIVTISVRGETAGWVARTLSEVEEQVERTWLNQTRPLLVLVGLFLTVVIVLLSQLLTLDPNLRSDRMWLRAGDLDRVEAMLARNDTLSVDDLRTVATLQLRNILAQERPAPAEPRNTRSTVMVAVPAVVIMAVLLILLGTCYPNSVFLWGDEVERYAAIVQRRKILWSLVTGVTVVGVLSAFIFEVVSNWLS